ncbi:hypothetical protein [Ventosimonas gracilis]|nr:hypothetical protein [Ventosimonas gracilis]
MAIASLESKKTRINTNKQAVEQAPYNRRFIHPQTGAFANGRA